MVAGLRDQRSDGTVPKTMRSNSAVEQPEKATFRLTLEIEQKFDKGGERL
jgi:hypothetical protein